jgi:hypothetical protein
LRLAFTDFCLILLALSLCASRSAAQEPRGSTPAALGGAALGAYSGSVFGLLGGVGPCNRILSGPACPRIAAAVGAGVGLVAGAWMGTEDSGSLNARWRGAGYGAAAGTLVGYGLSRGVRQYGWLDVGTFLGVGVALGTSPLGAVLGFGTGAAVGGLLWLVVPEMKIGDAVAVSLVGLAVGGLAGWVSGMDVHRDSPPLVIPLQVRFR